MNRRRQLGRLYSLLAAMVVTLALIGVLHRQPISASDEVGDLRLTDHAAADWIWSTQTSSCGYLWSEGSPRFESADLGHVSVGYSWSSDLSEY